MKAPAIVKAAARAIRGKSEAQVALSTAIMRHDELSAELIGAEEAKTAAAIAKVDAIRDDADLATLRRLEAMISDAENTYKLIKEKYDAACKRLDEAQTAFEAEQNAEKRSRAMAIRTEIEPLVAPAYADAAKGVLLAMRHIAKADLELAELETHPDGRPPRSVEHGGRFKDWLSEVETSRREVELWTDLAGTILDPQPAASRIGEDRDGWYLMKDSGSNSVQFRIKKALFHRIEFRPDKLGRINWVRSIVSQISLPGIGDPDTQLWPPAREPIAREPAKLLRQLDAALGLVDEQLSSLQKRRDDREIEIRFERVPDEPAAERLAGHETDEDGEAE